jgi:hypothetical protein
MASSIQRLREKLCRELAQSEHDAIIHCTREASRYGAQAPGQVLRVIADHARELRPRLEHLWGAKQPVGVRAARAVGELFSAVRHFAIDWMIDAERSYRATLLGLEHGVGVARLLREVFVQQQDYNALRVCDELLEGRTRLLARAADRLRWFAEHPDVALRSSRGKVQMKSRRAAQPRGSASQVVR